MAAIAVDRHTLDVPPGQARWWRVALSLGADCDVARGAAWAAVLGAGAVAGLASISGSGFAVDRTSRSLDAGAEARARVAWRGVRLQPWLGVSVIGWARRQTLDLQGAPTSATLSRIEPMMALGADVTW